MFDPLFDSVDGTLLATVDFDIVGSGTTEFNFALGDLGIVQLPGLPIVPSFGNATLAVELTSDPGPGLPEPSSAIVLIMGSVAVFARRKRV